MVNQKILEEITVQNYSKISKNIQDFIAEQVSLANTKGVILGLSGGIDSAVLAYLASNALQKNVLALIMPDSKISPNEETEDAQKIIDAVGIPYKLIDINMIHAEFSNVLEPDDKALGNLRARIRSNILYYYANSKNYLVLGSSDKSENLIGYFTKFGDGSADILPIISLYKTQIRKLAEFLGIPENIIAKKSSPHLWKNHIAEKEIGASYEEIDSVLYCLIDKKISIEEIVDTTKIEKSIVDKIYQLYKNSQHKRITATKFELNHENS